MRGCGRAGQASKRTISSTRVGCMGCCRVGNTAFADVDDCWGSSGSVT